MRSDRRTREKILQIVDKIKKGYAPEKIILFGSYAYGNPTKESDIDLLIIKETSKPFHKRWAEVCDMVHGILGATPFSPFVITSKELKRRLARGDHFFKEILSKGEVFYEAKFSS